MDFRWLLAGYWNDKTKINYVKWKILSLLKQYRKTKEQETKSNFCFLFFFIWIGFQHNSAFPAGSSSVWHRRWPDAVWSEVSDENADRAFSCCASSMVNPIGISSFLIVITSEIVWPESDKKYGINILCIAVSRNRHNHRRRPIPHKRGRRLLPSDYLCKSAWWLLCQVFLP